MALSARQSMPRTIPATIRLEALHAALDSVRRQMEANRVEAMAIIREIGDVHTEQREFTAPAPKVKLPETPASPAKE